MKKMRLDEDKISQIPSDITDFMLEEQTSMKNVQALKLIAESRARTLGALKHKSRQFRSYLESSNNFLRSHLGSKVQMTILYVDLVDSTHMSLILPLEKLTVIIQTFVQEMTIVVANNSGYVLKYVGDAIIAYFPAVATEKTDFPTPYKRALFCAIDMLITVEHGINAIFQQFDFPDLHMKIGIDSGENAIIEYGSSSETKSHVDIIGYPMNLTAKITSLAKPDHIMIGNTTYQGLDLRVRNVLAKIGLERVDYIDYQTGDAYMVFSFGLHL